MEVLRKIDIHAHIAAFPQWTPAHPGSGANALTRDPEHAVSFLSEFQDRIYYGCDICASFNTHPFTFRAFLDGLCESGSLSEVVYRKICRDNAVKLLGL